MTFSESPAHHSVQEQQGPSVYGWNITAFALDTYYDHVHRFYKHNVIEPLPHLDELSTIIILLSSPLDKWGNWSRAMYNKCPRQHGYGLSILTSESTSSKATWELLSTHLAGIWDQWSLSNRDPSHRYVHVSVSHNLPCFSQSPCLITTVNLSCKSSTPRELVTLLQYLLLQILSYLLYLASSIGFSFLK